MYDVMKSSLFEEQALAFIKGYRARAGNIVARNFAAGIDASICFISKNPQACAVYTHIGAYEYRKWGVKEFPHSIYFRISNDTIILEAIYAQRMEIEGRFLS